MSSSAEPVPPVTLAYAAAAPVPGTAPSPMDPVPTRVIEIGDVTAGIAVPEGRGVRFFSSARAFDGIDGAVFGSADQAARAARHWARSAPRPGLRG